MQNIDRIQRISRLMRLFCTFAIPAIPLTLGVMWLNFELWGRTHPDIIGLGPLPQPMPAMSLILGFVVSMIPGSLAVYAALRLRQLFDFYARGLIFTAENTRCLRGFALAILGFALAKPVAGALMSVVLTMTNPPGQRMLAISFGSSELTTLFVGCIFLIIAWIMDEGRELAEEQAQIV